MTMPAEPTDKSQPSPDDAWEIDGAAMYRAVSFAIALPAFMVGTALFMLGFSLTNSTVLHIACVLYSLAFAGFTSRIIVGRQPWRTTAPYIACIAAAGLFCYLMLRVTFWLIA